MSQSVMDKFTAQCIVRCDYAKTGDNWAAYVNASQIVRAAKVLYDEEYHIEDVCALDTNDGFMVVYHFAHFEKPGRITLKVLASREKPEVPTISGVFSGADWHERETHDFHGVVFTGHPNLIPILLPAEGEEFHPLLKEDKKRKSLKELVELGDVVKCDAAIEALFAEDEPAEEASA